MTTIAPTTVAPTTVADIEIVCDPLEIGIFPKRTLVLSPFHGRDWTLDYIHDAGALEINVSQEGEMFTVSQDEGASGVSLSIHGTLVIGLAIVCSPLEIGVSTYELPIITGAKRCDFAKWSRIGRADFTITKDNEAGERPLGWKGCVYQCMKLDNTVVYYGENGVTALIPQGVHMGMKVLHKIGVISKQAMCGNEDEHFFIDETYKLHRLTSQGKELLDYSEYISNMSAPVMSMDPETGIIYICDGTYGYVYSSRYKSFGVGPINITGVGSRDGILYVTAPDIISTPKLLLTTDIYDFGTRKPKTIQSVEVGTDLSNKLEVMIETRLNNREEFNQSIWKLVNPSGIAYIPCFGIEFRFNLRSFIYEYLEVDYLKIDGSIHEFNYLNSVQG